MYLWSIGSKYLQLGSQRGEHWCSIHFLLCIQLRTPGHGIKPSTGRVSFPALINIIQNPLIGSETCLVGETRPCLGDSLYEPPQSFIVAHDLGTQGNGHKCNKQWSTLIQTLLVSFLKQLQMKLIKLHREAFLPGRPQFRHLHTHPLTHTHAHTHV